MEFRYDFGQKLDLSKFLKQGPYYIGLMREVTYSLYVADFIMRVEIARPANHNAHMVTIYFYEIKRDEDGEIISSEMIIPYHDLRFEGLLDIQEKQGLWSIDQYKAHFDSNSAVQTVEKICKILKFIHKINNLKAFL